MKNSIKFLFAAAVVSLQACNFLDQKPVASKPADIALNTMTGANSVLIQAYSQLQSGGFYGGDLLKVNELYCDNLNKFKTSTSTYNDADFSNPNFGVFNNYNASIWQAGYSAIYHANVGIHCLDAGIVTDGTDSAKNWLRGQCLFVRALAHFEIVRMYALPYQVSNGASPGIPVRAAYVASLSDAFSKVDRSPVSVVYAQVIKDLNDAMPLLSKTETTDVLGFANYWAAKALLSEVYFNMQDYGNAFQQADDVIKGSGATLPIGNGSPRLNMLSPFFNTGFAKPVFSKGVLFQIANYTNSDGSGGVRGGFYVGNPTSSTYYYPMNTDAAQAFRAMGGYYADTMLAKPITSAGYYTPAGAIDTVFQLKKWSSFTAVNIPVIRLAEVYLTRAEAGLNSGKLSVADALTDVNNVTAVGNVTNASITDKDALLDYIHKVRRVELMYENDRFHELRRLGSTAMRRLTNGTDVRYDDESKLLRIPTSETNANLGIHQNGQ